MTDRPACPTFLILERWLPMAQGRAQGRFVDCAHTIEGAALIAARRQRQIDLSGDPDSWIEVHRRGGEMIPAPMLVQLTWDQIRRKLRAARRVQ